MTSNTTYDLIVIGAGPAGCAAAITATRAGASVLLLERGRYPRHKVCGEFVSAESVALLQSLLENESLALFANAPRISGARLLKGRATAVVPLDPPAISVARYELDNALFQTALRSGVCALQKTAAASVERRANGFVVTTGHESFTSRTLIVAAGRCSNLRREESPQPGERYLGIKAHFRTAGDFPRNVVELHFFDKGYCGIDAVADNTVSVCALVPPKSGSTLEEIFSRSKALSARARGWQKLFEPITTFPLIFGNLVPERDGILYAGDAAGFVDPFIGDGISLALQSGTAAANCLATAWREEVLLNAATAQYRAHYETRFAPVFRNAAGIRRLLEMPDPLLSAFAQLFRVPLISRQFVRLTRAA